MEILQHVNATAITFIDDSEGRVFWFNIESMSERPDGESEDRGDADSGLALDASYDSRPELFSLATGAEGEEEIAPTSPHSYVMTKLAGEVARLEQELRASLVELEASLRGQSNDSASMDTSMRNSSRASRTASRVSRRLTIRTRACPGRSS